MTAMLNLTVNGEPRRAAPGSIADLVRSLDLDPAKGASTAMPARMIRWSSATTRGSVSRGSYAARRLSTSSAAVTMMTAGPWLGARSVRA